MTREKAFSAYLAARALAALPGLSPSEAHAARQDLVRAAAALRHAETRAEIRAAYSGFTFPRRPHHARP